MWAGGGWVWETRQGYSSMGPYPLDDERPITKLINHPPKLCLSLKARAHPEALDNLLRIYGFFTISLISGQLCSIL